MLTDYVASRTRQLEPNLSVLEAEDLRIPRSAVRDTSTWTQQTRTLDALPEYLETFKQAGEDLRSTTEQMGTPHTLVVAVSGMRAAELTRALRQFQSKEVMVAKLFAKHMKLAETREFCQRRRISVGVGTPQRLRDLIDEGALRINGLRRVVVDASYIGQKRRGILELKDTHRPLLELLGMAKLRERFGKDSGQIQLLFY